MIGWSPALRVDTVSLVRPLPWAHAVPGSRFTPERWGPSVFQIASPGGAHLLVRRHGAPELSLWLPADLAPVVGEPFGLYLHADRYHASRVRAVGAFARAIGRGLPLRRTRYRNADRQAAMLCIHDLTVMGQSLRQIANVLLDPAPDSWRSSSERSDLRRLAEAGQQMGAGQYRTLLGPSLLNDRE